VLLDLAKDAEEREHADARGRKEEEPLSKRGGRCNESSSSKVDHPPRDPRWFRTIRAKRGLAQIQKGRNKATEYSVQRTVFGCRQNCIAPLRVCSFPFLWRLGEGMYERKREKGVGPSPDRVECDREPIRCPLHLKMTTDNQNGSCKPILPVTFPACFVPILGGLFWSELDRRNKGSTASGIFESLFSADNQPGKERPALLSRTTSSISSEGRRCAMLCESTQERTKDNVSLYDVVS
jgi:hypothetical protein